MAPPNFSKSPFLEKEWETHWGFQFENYPGTRRENRLNKQLEVHKIVTLIPGVGNVYSLGLSVLCLVNSSKEWKKGKKESAERILKNGPRLFVATFISTLLLPVDISVTFYRMRKGKIKEIATTLE